MSSTETSKPVQLEQKPELVTDAQGQAQTAEKPANTESKEDSVPTKANEEPEEPAQPDSEEEEFEAEAEEETQEEEEQPPRPAFNPRGKVKIPVSGPKIGHPSRP